MDFERELEGDYAEAISSNMDAASNGMNEDQSKEKECSSEKKCFWLKPKKDRSTKINVFCILAGILMVFIVAAVVFWGMKGRGK